MLQINLPPLADWKNKETRYRISKMLRRAKKKMQWPYIKETSQSCLNCRCLSPQLGFPEPQKQRGKTRSTIATCRQNFAETAASSVFANPESLPSLQETFAEFSKAYPQYNETCQVDQIWEQEYYHISLSHRTFLDYIGHRSLLLFPATKTWLQKTNCLFFSTFTSSNFTFSLIQCLLQDGKSEDTATSRWPRIRIRVCSKETDHEFSKYTWKWLLYGFHCQKNISFQTCSRILPFPI